MGAEILSGSRSPLLVMAEQIALTHHERSDGQGYPHGLHGGQIALPGRIVAVADVFDALTHERPYKRAWPVPEALAEIRQQVGRLFDPDVLQAFLRLEHPALLGPVDGWEPPGRRRVTRPRAQRETPACRR